MSKKVKVNKNCIGCGACIAICPDVFIFSDEGVAQVNGETTCSDNDCINDAKNTCPVEAIQCIEE